MNQIAVFALVAWVPLSLGMFTVLPPRRAVIASVVGAWLFLPVGVIDLSGIPDLSKTSATAIGTLVGALLFDMPRVSAFRPRWYDLPMAVFCASAGASSLSNGMGAYDALSQTLNQLFTLGIPYLVGRLYFTDLEGLQDLAVGIVAGGLVYVPFCMWEVRMSPNLHYYLYGFSARPFHTAMRMGGYRPSVFMATGLEVGIWMGAALLLAYALWAGKARDRIGDLPMGGVVLPALAVTFLFCRSAGALVLTAASFGTLWLCRRLGWALPAVALLLVPPAYIITRTTGLWDGKREVAIAESIFGADRAGSLQFRFDNEDILIRRALIQPWLGWGGYGRASIDEAGNQAVSDGYWIIIMGNHGIIGLTAWALAMLLPGVLFLRRLPVATWGKSAGLEAPALSILLSCYTIDCLLNAMINPVYILAIGGLMGLRVDPARGRSAPGGTPGASWADEYESAARHLLAEGQVGQAVEARECAIEIRSRESAEAPGDLAARAALAASLNNLAWLLADGPDPAFRDAARAASLAGRATELDPGRPTLWNTLGAAFYRSGQWERAIGALERAISLGDDGSALASASLLAMAHHRRGDADLAGQWLAEAEACLAAGGPASPAARALLAEAAGLLAPGQAR